MTKTTRQYVHDKHTHVSPPLHRPPKLQTRRNWVSCCHLNGGWCTSLTFACGSVSSTLLPHWHCAVWKAASWKTMRIFLIGTMKLMRISVPFQQHKRQQPRLSPVPCWTFAAEIWIFLSAGPERRWHGCWTLPSWRAIRKLPSICLRRASFGPCGRLRGLPGRVQCLLPAQDRELGTWWRTALHTFLQWCNCAETLLPLLGWSLLEKVMLHRGQKKLLKDANQIQPVVILITCNFHQMNWRISWWRTPEDVPFPQTLFLLSKLEDWQEIHHLFPRCNDLWRPRYSNNFSGNCFYLEPPDGPGDGTKLSLSLDKIRAAKDAGVDLQFLSVGVLCQGNRRFAYVTLLDRAIWCGQPDCAEAVVDAGIELKGNDMTLACHKQVLRGESLSLEMPVLDAVTSEAQIAAAAAGRASLKRSRLTHLPAAPCSTFNICGRNG